MRGSAAVRPAPNMDRAGPLARLSSHRGWTRTRRGRQPPDGCGPPHGAGLARRRAPPTSGPPDLLATVGLFPMFVVDEAAAEAIRQAYEGGEPSAVAGLRRRFPGITDDENARLCARSIAG